MTQEEFFSRYRYDRTSDRLGTGSFGSVYRAYDTFDDTFVALKISPVSPDSSSLRLQREVDLVLQLPPHPNVARYDACFTFTDTTGDFDVAVLRYYPDGSLLELMKAGSLTPDTVNDLLRQLLTGLRFLHQRGIIHRDLKPANILIARRPDGTIVPKITDFGISMMVDGAGDTLNATATVSYASPEQLMGNTLTSNADLWSFGVIAYELLSGRQPFTAGNLDPASIMGRSEIASRITSGRLPEDIGLLPRPWDAIVSACLIVDPVRRTNDEDTLLSLIPDGISLVEEENDDITRIADSGYIPPVVPPSTGVGDIDSNGDHSGTIQAPPLPPEPDKKTNPWIVVLIVLLVILCGVLIYLLYSSTHNKDEVRKVPMDEPIAPTIVNETDPIRVVTIDTTAWTDDSNYSPDSAAYAVEETETIGEDTAVAADSVDSDWYN